MASKLAGYTRGALRLAVYCRREEPAVDRETVAGHEAGRVGREEHRGADEFLWAAEAFHRGPRDQLLASVGAGQQRGVELRREHAGDQRVHRDVVLRPL